MDIPTSTRASVLNGYVTAWFAVASKFTPQEFYQGGWTTASEVVSPGNPLANFASELAFMIPHLQFWGVNPTLMQAIDQWAAAIWPSYKWPAALTATCTNHTNGHTGCSTDLALP